MVEQNPRAVIGGNNPPLEPREAIAIHILELREETEGCAYGQAIETAEQAAVIAELHRKWQEAIKTIEGIAKKEKEPHQEAVKEIDAWKNRYVAKGLKTTPDGICTKAQTVTGNLLAGWANKLEAERKEQERIAREEAERVAREAMEAHKAAMQSTDLDSLDDAEANIAEAKAAVKQADKLAKEKTRIDAGEGMRAVTARKVWSATVTNYAAAYGHYKQRPEFMADFHALIESYAQKDARNQAARNAGVDGVVFEERTVV